MQWVVEDCLCLDVNRLAKAGWFSSGSITGKTKWETGASINLEYHSSTHQLILNYELEGESNPQAVTVTKQPCHFGGYRYYFHCPGCGSRRYKLHCAHSGFYCRDCYRLPYYSQECSHLDGLTRKIHKLTAKIDGLPKHTRTATVRQLESKLEKLDQEWARSLVNSFGSFLGIEA